MATLIEILAKMEDRIYRRSNNPDDCILYFLNPTSGGYGRVLIKGVRYLAARSVLENKLRRKLLPNEDTRHTCDNTYCVNERHLVVGSRSDNIKDSVIRKRHAHSIKTHCPKGHEYTPTNTYTYLNRTGRNCKECVKINNRRWREKQ